MRCVDPEVTPDSHSLHARILDGSVAQYACTLYPVDHDTPHPIQMLSTSVISFDSVVQSVSSGANKDLIQMGHTRISGVSNPVRTLTHGCQARACHVRSIQTATGR